MSDQTQTPDPLDDVIALLNENTNKVAEKLERLLNELSTANTGGHPPTAAQLQSLGAICDHLKALGADPTNPVPTPPAAAVVFAPTAPAA